MKTWWAEIVSEHALGSHQLLVLRAACQAWDRMEQARKVLACSGLSYTDDKGMHRAMPEVAIERDSRTAFVRAVRELNLKLEPPKGSGLEPAALYR